MAVVAGQILSSCIPYVDIRDVAENLVNGDYMFARLSALGLVPIAGDTAKAVSKLGKFAIKNLDNVAKVADVVEFTSKYYPDAVKLLAKNDDFVSAAKAMSNNTSLKMTKTDAERINKILDDAGLSEYVIKGSTEIVDLTKTALKHPLNRHAPARVAQQFKYMDEEAIIKYLDEVTFFNKSWTEEQIIDALNYGYKEALSKGVTTGEYNYKYLGDNVTIYLEEGVFKSGYGDYVYSYEEIKSLLND